jgi:AcrR family transcriptional regulator
MTQAQVTTAPRAARQGLAERKRRVTREAIMEAAAAVIREEGIDFSVQDVADRVGVAHRTVYRHFESRERLLDAVIRWRDAQFEADGAPEPRRLDEFPEAMERLFRAADRRPDLVRAGALMALVRGEQSESRTERTARLRRLIELECPHLPPEEVAGAFAVLRTLASSIGWYVLTTQFGLTGAQSGPAVRRALEALIADLRRRDAEAAAAQ